MFLYVLETKVNHQVSEHTLLDGAGNRKEKHNTKQKQKKQKRKHWVPLCRILLRGDNSFPLKRFHCAAFTERARCVGQKCKSSFFL